ncbi:MAG: hypothetical protein ABSB26_08935 [Nitrososphaerales archaeon]|jgi:uncharacterized membrane protein
MSILFACATYVFGTVESALFLGAAFYSYRLTRLAGAFGAWILMITALIILTSHSVAELLQLAIQVPFNQLVVSTNGMSAASFIISSISGAVLAALLFSAMYQLHGKFRQLSR